MVLDKGAKLPPIECISNPKTPKNTNKKLILLHKFFCVIILLFSIGGFLSIVTGNKNIAFICICNTIVLFSVVFYVIICVFLEEN